MFTNIVWATDGSAHADRALEYALRIADHEHARLQVVHIVERFAAGRTAGQNTNLNEEEIDNKIRAQARRASADHGVNCFLHMTAGNASNVAGRIAEIAAETDADLIVVGTLGRSALGGLVLGSVTQRLLHIAGRPVLAVPPAKQPEALPESEILVATL